MRWFATSLVLGLVPGVAIAEPTPITSLEQVQQLCSELQPQPPSNVRDAAARAHADADQQAKQKAAMQHELLLTLPPGQFRVAEADADTHSLTIDTQRAFRFFKGAAVFYPVDQQDLDLILPEGQELPARTDDLTLKLVVRPGQDADQPCLQGLAKDYVMGVEILSASLTTQAGQLVAKLDEDESIDRPANPNGTPQVEIDPVLVDGSAASAAQVTEGVQQLKSRLTQCYQTSLSHTPALDGTMVVGFAFSSDGKPADLTMMADSVQDDAMASCVTQALSQLSLPKPGKAAKADKGLKPNRKTAASSGQLAFSDGGTSGSHDSRASITLRFERK
jgi:hypothetical protein